MERCRVLKLSIKAFVLLPKMQGNAEFLPFADSNFGWFLDEIRIEVLNSKGCERLCTQCPLLQRVKGTGSPAATDPETGSSETTKDKGEGISGRLTGEVLHLSQNSRRVIFMIPSVICLRPVSLMPFHWMLHFLCQYSNARVDLRPSSANKSGPCIRHVSCARLLWLLMFQLQQLGSGPQHRLG